MAKTEWIGKRVRIIVDCSSESHRAGKVGTITGLKEITPGNSSPIITLDSGEEIGGWESWWDFEPNVVVN